MKQLRRIDLSDNALANDFKAPYAYDGVFTDSPLLESIDISSNNFALAPLGMFVGLSNIRELDMSGNTVAAPPIIFLAARRDADGHEPPPAQVSAVALSGALFPMSGALTAKNAEGVPASVQLPAGGFWSAPFNAGQRTAGVGAEIRLRDATDIPDMQCGGRPCLRGGEVIALPELFLFKRAPSATDNPPSPTLAVAGESISISLDSLFKPADAGCRLTFALSVDKQELLRAEIRGGTLHLVANEDGRDGEALVSVSASAPGGPSSTVAIHASVGFNSAGLPIWLLWWQANMDQKESFHESENSFSPSPLWLDGCRRLGADVSHDGIGLRV